MKMPEAPPDWSEILQEVMKSGRSRDLIQWVNDVAKSPRYLHWSELKYRTPPKGLTHREWWLAHKFSRQSSSRNIPLMDMQGRLFRYVDVDPIPERLHEITMGVGGRNQIPDPIVNPETRREYLVRSLAEEAITSSQLEGATTTRKIAMEMLRAGRRPRDRSEKMILNNYMTMQKIREVAGNDLSPDLVFEIHRLVTEDTLEDPAAAGRFRRSDEAIAVFDDSGRMFYRPPPAGGLSKRMEAMCAFANSGKTEKFVHPVIRSILLHFWLAYDHPFVDGNGRTARALFYWSMLRHGFSLCEFISISSVILKGPARYARAFLHTETDDNDLTYFILYHLDVMRRAVEELSDYIERKTRQLRSLEGHVKVLAGLNHRQRALINHALNHPGYVYTVETHRMSHQVVYQTARTDLLQLRDRGLLVAEKRGKAWCFLPYPDLGERVAAVSSRKR